MDPDRVTFQLYLWSRVLNSQHQFSNQWQEAIIYLLELLWEKTIIADDSHGSVFACVGYRDDDGRGWDVGDSGHDGGMVKKMLKLPFSVDKSEKFSIKISMLLAL